MEKKSDILNFLMHNREFFVDQISAYYPLSEQCIVKHKDILNWKELGCNEALPWSMKFFVKYEKFWVWGNSEDDRYAICLNMNPKLPWSVEFIEKYKDKINWYLISQSWELFTWTPDLIEKFKDKWCWENLSWNKNLPWSDELVEKYRDYWDWDILSGNNCIDWTPGMLQKYNGWINIDEYLSRNEDLFEQLSNPYDLLNAGNKDKTVFSKAQMAEILEKPNWRSMSSCKWIPWTGALIEYYKDKWDWYWMSINESLPWSVELIEKFEDRWEWGELIPVEEGLNIEEGLSDNPSLPWTKELIAKYKNRWCWLTLSINQGVSWSLELLEEFHDLWDWEYLTRNKVLWEKLFYPFLDEKNIDDLLNRIREKNADKPNN